MNEINNTNISQWIEKFLDGDTTCAEERELYHYFSRKDLPEEAEPYREMFAWYASLQQAASVTELEKVHDSHADTPASKVRILRMRAWQWISVAAILAILLTVGFMLRPSTSNISEEYMAYRGSYIIRDGKKITDLNIVVPEILRAEQFLNESVEEVDRSFDEMDRAMMNSVSSELDMSNPAVREAVQTAFEY